MKKITVLSILSLASVMVFGQVNKVINANPPTGKYFTMAADQRVETDYMAKTIIFAVKEEYRVNCSAKSIDNLMGFEAVKLNLGAVSVEKIFPNHQKPAKKFNELGQKYADLSLIYSLKYVGDATVEKAINKLFESGYFEYAQPWYIPKYEATTNDPLAVNLMTASGQMHLYRINALGTAPKGFDVQTGSVNVVVGIVDTGTELTHTDLTTNIKYNTNDGPTVNGVDNDADGYIDNYRGWDVAMNDNDPTWQGDPHGVHVSGCASASTNNNIGGAGSGYNCKFLPVKIANASGALTAAYQGITYAADHGCDIINCSWGGTGGSSFEQTVIDYATINMNRLVVCAAGNNGQDQAFYPSALNYVLSVCATNENNDVKAAFSNYHYSVDVSAPGNGINATYTGNSYAELSGTSMSSPVCAGMCAIVKSQFPSYTGLQVGERVKATTFNNYSSNPSFMANKLGTGRIDMYAALTNLTAKSVVFNGNPITDNNDDVFLVNDTMRISGTFVNYLTPTTSACAATLTPIGPNAGYISMLTGSFTVGALATLGTINNNGTPFRAKIIGAPPLNAVIDFRLTITDGTYTANYFFSVTVNVDYINITVNDIYTTITSKGRIGWNADGQVGGLGFKYLDSAMMYEASMMIANSATKCSDMFRGGGTAGDVDNSSIQNVYKVNPNVFSDFDVSGQFRDNVAPSPIGVSTHHTAYAWVSSGNRKFVIVKYVVKNTTTGSLTGVRVGVIADWDVTATTYGNNKANQDVARRLGYVYCTNTGGQYVGTKVLTQGGFNSYGIDNVTGGGGGIDVIAGTPEFDTGEKYTAMSTSRPTAGNTVSTGNDVMNCVSTGPYTIAAGDSIIVAFALLAGDNLAQIQTSADAAQVKWDGLTGVNPSEVINEFGMSNFPNPTNGTSYIQFYLPGTSNVDLKMYDVTGREVSTIVNGKLDEGKHEFINDVTKMSNGIYFYKLTVDGNTYTQKVVVNK